MLILYPDNSLFPLWSNYNMLIVNKIKNIYLVKIQNFLT